MNNGTSARRRTKVEMSALDALIRPLYEGGMGCRLIAAQLDENPAVVYKRLRAMGIMMSRDERYEEQQAIPSMTLPFSAAGSTRQLRAAAIGEAVSWFLGRGYVPSIPVEATRYDIVVESDDGLKRVQVKSTTSRDKRGQWIVGIARLEYGRGTGDNCNGRRGRSAYRADEVDFFFIVTAGGDRYLVPIAATGGSMTLTLDRKYAEYRV